MILRNRFSKGFFYVTLSAEGKYLQIEWALSACYRGVSWWCWWCWLSPITYNATCEAVPGEGLQVSDSESDVGHLPSHTWLAGLAVTGWLVTTYRLHTQWVWWVVTGEHQDRLCLHHRPDGDNDNACTCSVLTLKCKIVSHRSETKSGEMALGCALLNICGSVYWILLWSLSWWDSLILKSTTY